jgi:hypothetical protein
MFSFPRIYTAYASLLGSLLLGEGYAVYPDRTQAVFNAPGQHG